MLWVYLIHDGGYDCEDGFVVIREVSCLVILGSRRQMIEVYTPRGILRQQSTIDRGL
jgi:hypothetical protein